MTARSPDPVALNRPTTIMLVDDHPLLRTGLRKILEDHHYCVVGEAGNAAAARRLLEEHRPSIAILDIGLPGVRGVELAAEMRASHPDTRVIFLTVHKEEEYVHQALSIGASGYVLKDCLETEVLDAVRAAERGGRYLTPLISSELVQSYARQAQPTCQPVFDRLTVREREVLSLLCDGRSTKAVAEALCISGRTVEHHRQAVMKKLGAHSVADLLKCALRSRLVEM